MRPVVMGRKQVLCFLVMLLLGLGAVGNALAQNIRVGVLLPLSGKLSVFGEMQQKSYLLALEELQKSGGKPIDLIFADTAGRPDKGLAATRKLISEAGVVMLAGTYSSSVAWEVSALAEKSEIPFLSSTAAADKITEVDRDYVFRLNQPASEYGEALAGFLRQLPAIRTAGIIQEDSPFGNYRTRRFLRQCRKLKIRLTAKQLYQPGAADFSAQLEKLKTKNPDLIYAVAQAEDAANLMRQARRLRISPRLFLGCAVGFTAEQFKHNAGQAAELTCSPTLWSPSAPYPGAMNYYSRFLVRYDQAPDYHGAQAYAAMQVIGAALRNVFSPNTQSIREALLKIELDTVYGNVKFISYEDKKQQNRVSDLVLQWIDGRLEVIRPRRLATARHIHPYARNH